VAGAVLLAVLALAAAGHVEPGDAADRLQTATRLAQAADGSGRTIRQIAPDVVAPPSVDPETLERDAPRAPLSDLGTAAPPREAPRRQGLDGAPQIFRPVATAAGRLEAHGSVIAIAGIDILEPEQDCRAPDGTEWPCGMVARTAFRSFLRGRALDCDLPEGPLPDRLSAACRLGGQDLGAWLVANGWAKVSSTGPYAQEQSAAIEARRGIFGPGPQAMPAAPVLPGVSALSSTAPLLAPETLPQEPAQTAPLPPSVGGIERAPLPAPKGLY
jgi:endonuclease YncB( thermonuclease family)